MLSPPFTAADRAAELATSRRAGFTLPQGFYNDAALFEHDLERIFFRHWLLAGHVGRLPKPGSYFLYDMGGESLAEVHATATPARDRIMTPRDSLLRFVEEKFTRVTFR